MLGWMLAAGLAVQAQAITAQNVDAFLAEQVAGLQANVGRDDNGLTLTAATLQGRTITMQWLQANELTPGTMDMIEQMRLASCDEEDVQALLGLGVVERNVYVDPDGLRFQFDLSTRTCDGERMHTSDRWRTVLVTPRGAAAVDLSTVTGDGPRRHFLMALVRQSSDPDEAFRKVLYAADCEAWTAGRRSDAIYDQDSQLVGENLEPLAPTQAKPGSPVHASMKAVCRGEWPDTTERDLAGFLAQAMKALEPPAGP